MPETEVNVLSMDFETFLILSHADRNVFGFKVLFVIKTLFSFFSLEHFQNDTLA